MLGIIEGVQASFSRYVTYTICMDKTDLSGAGYILKWCLLEMALRLGFGRDGFCLELHSADHLLALFIHHPYS